MVRIPRRFRLPSSLGAFLSWCLLVALLCGCRDKTESSRPHLPSIPATVEPADTPATKSAVAVVLDANTDAISESDSQGEWSTEAFQEQAGLQLDAIKRLLQASKPITANDVRDLVVPEAFQCGPLIEESTVVFDGQPLRISRAVQGSGQVRTLRGDAGLAETLEHLRSRIPTATNRKASFKITAVEGGEPARTTVEVRYVTESEVHVDQYAARWFCSWDTSDSQSAPRLLELTLQEVETAEVAGKPLFHDATVAVLGGNASYGSQLVHGLDYWLDRFEQRFGMNSAGWQGIAVADVNGDGREDVYVCQPGGLPNRLYVQQADGSAIDVSSEAGVDYWDHSHAALFLDLDGDADQDLVLATALGLIFLSNDGTAKFSVETAKLCPEAMPFTLAAADYDQDGDLDIYASCYSPRGKAIATQFLARPVPYHDANNGGRNCLFRNEGNWTYKNVTREVGLDTNNRRFSLAASWEDYDNDGDQDLYVANDYGRNNLYRNDAGHFADVASSAGVEDISAGMSVSWADHNQDGWMDLYVSNMWSSAGKRITFQRQFQPDWDAQVRADFQRHARGNSLFLNAGDGSFRDTSVAANVTMGRWAWCSQFIDINNDSWEDLVVANGFITQEDERDL